MNYSNWYSTKSGNDLNGGSGAGAVTITRANCTCALVGGAVYTITNDDATGWGAAAADEAVMWDTAVDRTILRIDSILGDVLTCTKMSGSITVGAAKNVNVGGAWLTVNEGLGNLTTSFVYTAGYDPRLNVGPGTYTEQAASVSAGLSGAAITLSGFLVTAGDECPGDVFPIITHNAQNAMTISHNYFHWDNLQFDCTGGAAKHGLSISGIVCYGRRFKASTTGTGASIAVNVTGASGNTLTDVHVTASTTVGIYANAKVNIIRARVEGAGTYGIQCYAASSDCRLVRCVVDSPGDDCYRFAGNGNVLLNSVGYGSAAGSGLQTVALSYQNTVLMGNIFDSNNQYGIEAAGECYLVEDYNAFRNNSVGERLNIAMPGANDVTLTADPFTNAAAGDFTLNNTTGGGALCRSAGPNGEDVGAYQHDDPATAAAEPMFLFQFDTRGKS